MSCDLFNNNSGNYVNPGLSPCAGTGEDKNAEFLDKGFGIVSGSEILAKLDLDHISIPVNSWVQRTQILQPLEVTFIQGLTTGTTYKTQGYTMPNLVSVDEVLDPFFLDVDISVNYYAGFTYSYVNIDASGNYALNIPVDTNTNTAFDAAGIKAAMTYDPSILNFQATLAGYEFNVTSVILNVIDASQDINSPFPTVIINGERVPQTYELVEDASAASPASKYPTTAFQGIFMTAQAPSDSTISCYDKWIYINHATDYVTTYTPLTVNYDSSVGTVLTIAYDASTILGVKPTITLGTPDVSLLRIDSSILTGLSITDSSIFDSSISSCIITESEIYQSNVWDSSLGINTVINQDSSVSNSALNNVWSNVYILVTNPSTGDAIYVMEDDSLDIDSSSWRVNISNSIIWDSSLNNTTIYDSSIYTTYFQDSSLIRCTTYNCTFDESTEADTRTIMIDASISCDASITADSSIFYHKQTRQLDIGMNGASTETHMSAGDYLTYVEENDLWRKAADIYAWTTAIDPSTYTPKNLINGFYVYNPHEFQYQIDYIVFV